MTTITITGSVTFDESSGLQNSNIGVPGEDNNDSDVLLSQLPTTFSDRLFGLAELNLSADFATARGVGKSADNFITVSGNGAVTALGFVDGSGNALPVYDGGPATDGVLTTIDAVDGGDVYLFSDPDLGNRMVLGVDSTGDIVFAVFLDPVAALTSAKVWIVQFEAIDNPNTNDPDDPVNLFDTLGVAASSELQFDFDDLPSGANLFGVVGDVNQAIIVIGEDPDLDGATKYTNVSDVIHTSQGGINATIGVNNQMFDPGEAAFFTYVNSPNPNFLSGVPGGLNATEADFANNIEYTGTTLEAESAAFTISQIQGNALATAKISAFDMAGTPQEVAFVNALGTGDNVNITAVRVFDETGTKIEDTEDLPNFNDPNVVVTFVAGGDVTVSGLDSGYKVEWVTEGDLHDQVLIGGVAGKFDVGGFAITDVATAAADIGSQVRFEDGGLSAAGQAPIPLEEDDINNAQSVGVNEDGSVNKHTDSGTLTTQLFPDVDEPATFSLSSDTSGLPALTSKGDPVAYDVTGNLLTAFVDLGPVGLDAGDRTVFTLSVAANGNYSFALVDQLDHLAGNGENFLSVDLSSVIQATDADGDTSPAADGSLEYSIQDDVPVLSGNTESASVDEDDLDTALSTGSASDGAGDGPPVTATGSIADLVTDGTDEDATFGITGTSGLPVLTSKGDAITYSVNGAGNLLTATADQGGADQRTVFTLSVAANGDYTYTLFDQLDHPDGLGENTISIDFSSVVAATDFDDDSVGLGDDDFVISVVDDIPSIGPITNGLVDFATGDSVSNLLNAVEGADEDAALSITSFTPSITYDFATLLGELSADGKTVNYFDDVNGTPGSFDPGDTLFFKLTLDDSDANAANWDYTFSVFQDPPPVALEFNFDNLPSGANLFGVVGDVNQALIVIGEDPDLDADNQYTNASDVIHTSQGGINATIGVNNQMFDPGDAAFFTYVNSPNPNFLSGAPGGLTATEADDADNIEYTGTTIEVDTASFLISQIQGNALATAKISAFDMAGTPQEVAFVNALGTGDNVNITAVQVFDETGTKIEDTEDLPNFNDPNVVVTFVAGGDVTVSGLDSGYKVQWVTEGDLHDQVLIAGVAGKFDIGAFEISQPQPTPDKLLSFTVDLEDFDGDSDSASFNIGIDGTLQFDDDIVIGV